VSRFATDRYWVAIAPGLIEIAYENEALISVVTDWQSDQHEDTTPSTEHLVSLLKPHLTAKAQVHFVLSAHWSLHFVAHNRNEFRRVAERDAHAAWCFNQRFGLPIHDWTIAVDSNFTSDNVFACAIPKRLLAALHQCAEMLNVRIASISSHLITLLNAACTHLSHPTMLFAIAEPGFITFCEWRNAMPIWIQRAAYDENDVVADFIERYTKLLTRSDRPAHCYYLGADRELAISLERFGWSSQNTELQFYPNSTLLCTTTTGARA